MLVPSTEVMLEKRKGVGGDQHGQRLIKHREYKI